MAGVVPGKGGETVQGVPVFDTMKQAIAATGADASLVFVPPPFAADSIMEAADGGIRYCVCITDGIPATTPDGQGQASTVSLTSAERIEVLTGPLAQLYGNSAGGVIQTTTREPGDQPQLDVSTTFGSYGLRRHDVQFSGRTGQVGIVADYSTFEIDGYRQTAPPSANNSTAC